MNSLNFFDNDTARDWVEVLANSRNYRVITQALIAVSEHSNYRETEICEEALAAAEVVAALLGNPSSTVPLMLNEWISRMNMHADPLADLAQQAIENIRANSDLADRWKEEGDSEWLASLQDLSRRLAI